MKRPSLVSFERPPTLCSSASEQYRKTDEEGDLTFDVEWTATKAPDGYQAIGGGVAFIKKKPGGDEWNATRLDEQPISSGDGHYSWRDERQTSSLLLIVILPIGFVIEIDDKPGPVPFFSKVFSERMTVCWKLSASNTLVAWRMTCSDHSRIGESCHRIHQACDALNRRTVEQQHQPKCVLPVVPQALNQGTSGQTPFDVFLAHNNRDKPSVTALADALTDRGLRPWLDSKEIPPGQAFQDWIQAAIRNARSIAICIGPDGLGKWQSLELKTAVSQCVNNGVPVIPVLLPNVDSIPHSLPFLAEFNWVQFHSRLDEQDPLDKLIWGITGIRPTHVDDPVEVRNVPIRPDAQSKVFTKTSLVEVLDLSEEFPSSGSLSSETSKPRIVASTLRYPRGNSSGGEQFEVRWDLVKKPKDWLQFRDVLFVAGNPQWKLEQLTKLPTSLGAGLYELHDDGHPNGIVVCVLLPEGYSIPAFDDLNPRPIGVRVKDADSTQGSRLAVVWFLEARQTSIAWVMEKRLKYNVREVAEDFNRSIRGMTLQANAVQKPQEFKANDAADQLNSLGVSTVTTEVVTKTISPSTQKAESRTSNDNGVVETPSWWMRIRGWSPLKYLLFLSVIAGISFYFGLGHVKWQPFASPTVSQGSPVVEPIGDTPDDSHQAPQPADHVQRLKFDPPSTPKSGEKDVEEPVSALNVPNGAFPSPPKPVKREALPNRIDTVFVCLTTTLTQKELSRSANLQVSFRDKKLIQISGIDFELLRSDGEYIQGRGYAYHAGFQVGFRSPRLMQTSVAFEEGGEFRVQIWNTTNDPSLNGRGTVSIDLGLGEFGSVDRTSYKLGETRTFEWNQGNLEPAEKDGRFLEVFVASDSMANAVNGTTPDSSEPAKRKPRPAMITGIDVMLTTTLTKKELTKSLRLQVNLGDEILLRLTGGVFERMKTDEINVPGEGCTYIGRYEVGFGAPELNHSWPPYHDDDEYVVKVWNEGSGPTEGQGSVAVSLDLYDEAEQSHSRSVKTGKTRTFKWTKGKLEPSEDGVAFSESLKPKTQKGN